MALNFQGEAVTPRRGVNLTGRKTTGIRTSVLKKGQRVITVGSDILEQLGLTDLGDGVKVKAVKGTGAVWGGKLMIQVVEDGPLTLRYVSKAKKGAAQVMSASLPFEHNAKAKYKVHPEDKAFVIIIPDADDPKAEKTAEEGGEGGGDAAAKEGDFAS